MGREANGMERSRAAAGMEFVTMSRKGDWVWCEVRDDGKEIMVKCVKVWVMGREWKARFTIHSLSRRGGSHLYPDRDGGQPTVGIEGNRIAISILLMSST